MAMMFPMQLPPEVRNDKRRAGECRVYDELKKQLDSSFHVFYSSPWLGTKPDGSEVDGEADFIVAHPDLGMLVIEVKGGRINIDTDGQWRSTDRDGITYKIKNPVKQARDSKHALTKKLKKSPAWKLRWIIHRHGVILCDVARPDRDFRPDMPLRLFAFQEDMAYLDEWVKSRFVVAEDDDDDGNVATSFGNDGINALIDMVARPIQLRVKLSSSVSQDLNDIELLTREQVWILKDLEKNRREAISGAAGTGKTILALHKAIGLAEDKEKRILLLCFNQPLAIRLTEMVEDYPNIKATHFHQFCRECFSLSGRPVPADERQLDAQWGDRLTGEFVDAFVDAGFDEYDAVIIDEGQDFRDRWLQSLEMVVKDGDDGVLYIFYDDNQDVMSRSGEYISTMPVSKYHLSKNFRNTRSVFSEAEKYYAGDFVRPIGPAGLPVIFVPVTDHNALVKYLAERIGNLTSNGGLHPEEIAVLVPDMQTLEKLGGKGRIGRYRTTSASSRLAECVVLDTVRRFKGLESPVVLLVLTSEMRDETDLLYTGITRSQSILDVIGPPRQIERMRA